MKVSSVSSMFLRIFYVLFTLYTPFLILFLSNDSVKFFLRIFNVLFTLFTPFLLLFSFPMKMSSCFYACFTYFLHFLRHFFSFFLSNENVKLFLRIFYAFFTHFLRTFYTFYAISSPFFFPMKMSSFFYAFFTYFLRLYFSSPFFLSNELSSFFYVKSAKSTEKMRKKRLDTSLERKKGEEKA